MTNTYDQRHRQNESFNNQLQDDSIDFKRYLSLFVSNWYWFAGALFISMCIAYGINRWSDEVFTVSATLLIKDEQLGGDTELGNIFPGAEIYKNNQNIQNEIGILKSYDLNYKVIMQLPEFHVEYIKVGKRGLVESRMYRKSPFIVLYDTIAKQIINQKVEIRILHDTKYEVFIDGDKNFKDTLSFGEKFSGGGFDFRLVLRDPGKYIFNPDASNKYYFRFLNPSNLANSFRGKLSVAPFDEQASLVTLTVSGNVPEQEADYLNKLMDVYINYGLDLKKQTATQTMAFIEDQLGKISDSLDRAERELESFRLNNKLIDISREGLVIQNKLEQIDGERTSLLLQKSYYDYLKEYVNTKKESGDIVAPSAMGISDPLLIKLVGELSVMQQQKKQMAVNFFGSSEPLNLLEANIQNTRKAISENISNAIQSITSSLTDIEERLSDLEKDIKKLPSTERQMIKIQRSFELNNTVYTYLLEKRAEAGITKASQVPDNRIIDSAGPHSYSRIRPRTRQNLMMALVLGFLIPILGIVLIDYLNNNIIDKKDVERGTRAPVIGFISHNNLKTEIPVKEKPGSSLAESFRSVRTNLKYFLKDIQHPVIAVSSTITAEGKTFISINLAAILASLGKKVLLIGLDLRKPRTHKILGINNSEGMSKFLIGECKFEEVPVRTEIENLWYAPSGPIPPNPAELIESTTMKEFIETAKQQFDFIVIDTPPVAIVTDALLLSGMTDIYLFVVRQRYSTKNTLGLIEELYKNENIRNIGIIINDISLTGYYGYGLRYGYSAGYGYTYGYNYYGYHSNSKYGYGVSDYYTEDET